MIWIAVESRVVNIPLDFCWVHECGVVILNAAQVPGTTTQDHLQVFNIETKTKMKSYQMNQQVRICK